MPPLSFADVCSTLRMPLGAGAKSLRVESRTELPWME